MRRIRLFLVVLRRNGGLPLLGGLVVLTLAAALVVLAFEPGVTNLGDALWYCWEVATTIGLGDVFAVSPVGRIASVVLSLYAIVVTAIVTGVIVTFYQERRDAQLKQSVAELLHETSARTGRALGAVCAQMRSWGQAGNPCPIRWLSWASARLFGVSSQALVSCAMAPPWSTDLDERSRACQIGSHDARMYSAWRMNMEVKVDVTDTKATVTVDGKLTVQTAPDLETAINEIDPQVTNLDIDLANVDYISSAGLRVLVAAQKKITAAAGNMRLLSPNDEVFEVFEMTGLSDIFTVER